MDTCWLFKETDNLATLLGYTLTASAIRFTYLQWSKEQKWKRKEALLSRIVAFSDTPGSNNALLMLDWGDREVPLWDNPNPNERYVRVERKEVALALLPSSLLTFVFKQKDKGSAIRDSFSDLFARLTHIEIFLEARLLDLRDVEVLMNPLIPNIRELKKSQAKVDQQLVQNLILFVNWKNLTGVKRFFNRFDIDLESDLKNLESTAKEEIQNGIWSR